MIILCADDYAMTEGISRAVGELAAAQRLSATSVMVNSAHWPAAAPRLRAHRGHLSIGLHLNLTLGAPLGPMPRLAPAGRLPGAGSLVARALCGLLDGEEVRGEIERQLDRFETGLQFPPDHIDGHQHVHVLPKVRTALLQTARRRYPTRPPLIRDPSGSLAAIAERRVAVPKAVSVSALALGFAGAAEGRGLPVNDSFAGFSTSTRRDLLRRRAAQRAAAAGPAAPRHVPSGPPRRRARRPRPGGHPAADGVRRDHARSGPSAAHLAAFAQRRWAGHRLAGGGRLKGERADTSAPGAQHPVRHGLAFLVSGATAFIVDALVLTLLTSVLGLHPIVARVAAIALAMVAGWLMHRTFTFRVRGGRACPNFCATPAWPGRRPP